MADHPSPKAIRDSCLALHLQRAARVVTRTYDLALRPVGLTVGQFSILVALSRPKQASLGTLAREMAMDRTTLTANLKPLERAGLIKSAPDPDDARSRLLLLSDAGRSKLGIAILRWQEAQSSTLGMITDPDPLRSDLRKLSHTT